MTETQPSRVLPEAAVLTTARQKLISELPDQGLGDDAVIDHILKEVAPGLNASSQSANYYGFVTGGATPAAKRADNIVTEYDQNVQVHLPNETIATDVEIKALDLLCQLLDFTQSTIFLHDGETEVRPHWTHRTFTTGATASNVLGLAIARQKILERLATKKIRETGGMITLDMFKKVDVAQVGLFTAMKNASIRGIRILTTTPHSSLAKAASIIGLGRDSVHVIGQAAHPHRFDMKKLEKALADQNYASIVAISCSEVNAGLFATKGEEMRKMRLLCDQFGSWIHVDGAFGLMARLLAHSEHSKQFSKLLEGVENIELADSITGDCHKLLNVPYDCGFFLSRDVYTGHAVFQNQAAYLGGKVDSDDVSPLHLGIENSRRFRALPVYASLLALGQKGYREMLERQILLARRIAVFLWDHEGYEVLPARYSSKEEMMENIYMVVMFRAKDTAFNETLVQTVKDTGKIYISPTALEGKPASRIAISNWQVDVEKDFELVREVLDQVHQVSSK
ncbi:pyridoxal-dependent decarboxylase [Venturia nashicola]|nr:pyridoxal-dependent decarboxylase [Venturia nashicola]